MTPRQPASRSQKRRPKASTRSRLIKIALLVGAIPALVVAIFLIRYYYLFDSLIEEKLGKQYDISETEIYAAPVVLYPGKRMSAAELVTRLRRLGYAEASGAPPAVSSYEVARPNHVLIRNEAALPIDGGQAVEVACSETTVRSLNQAGTHKPVATLALKPELLSSAINKNREKRRYVPYRDLPPVLVNAVLASEDRRFFSHSGVDPIRIIKAFIVDIREGETVQGASTLTQQFVKNYFLTPEKTWRRKLTDAYMSILLEKRLTKEQIFELYSNEVYLGQRGSFSIVGFGEAVEAYFDKNVKDVSLGEAAMLAGIISSPNRFSPVRHPDRAKNRRDLVLDLMAEYDMITAKEVADAKAKSLEINPSSTMNYSDAPYFVDYVQDILSEKFGDSAIARSKLRVYTTLDPDLQQAAFQAIRQGVVDLDAHFAKGKRGIPPGTVQTSLIAVDPRNGQILAMIGGRNYGQSQFNRITQSKRQPGSIFKPFVYTAALETAESSPAPLTVVSTVVDEPTQFSFEDLLYEPRNFKDEYFGQVTMRQAVTKSLNIATIKFAEKVGYSKIAELAQRLGLNEQIKPYPAMAIGAFEVTPLEMVRAYTAFANGGMRSDLMPILSVHDAKGNAVFTPAPTAVRSLSPQVAYMLTSLLQSVINNGTAAGARSRGFALPAAGKTGTSRDGWFAGYTPDILCIVWVGFDDNRELNLSGSQAALPIWTDFMKAAQTRRPLKGEGFTMPENIVEVEIDPTTGMLATDKCIERQPELFIKGSEPVIQCYGNSYEQLLGGTPSSIYSSPPRETGVTDHKGSPADERKKATVQPPS
jgi:penicillin-binding protein 1B